MDFAKIVSISGKQGLFEVINTRPNGLIIKSLLDGKSNFAPLRLNQYTLLDNISIYTDLDSEPLRAVFLSLKEYSQKNPVPESGSSEEDMRAYFKEILPNYDPEQVYFSDIKKVFKWFNILKDTDVDFSPRSEEEEE